MRWWRFKLSVPFSDDLRTWLFELDVYGKSTMGHQIAGLTGKKDHSKWTAGMPDLLLWKEQLAEVKGPGVACPSNRWPGFEFLRSRHDNEKLLQKALLQHQPRIEPRPLQAPGCVQSPDSDQEQPDQEVFSVLSECARESSSHQQLGTAPSRCSAQASPLRRSNKAINQQAQSKKGMGALNLPLVNVRVHEQLLLLEMFFWRHDYRRL
ncbi:hypothetical protein SELMODRAFT_425180 [Selaginella moellendorffii]|uniref:Uncharacterized protein n=1 Tax=Selaginella moellendorffii TaxID=88036 RepID=D8SS95_SELML|nr:hypothetical protein SELMODRAFT_425180 [Selaginella moellendorffii]